jgi:hypothetical protein
MRSLFVLVLLASPAAAAEPVYSWRSHANDPNRIYLYQDGKQVGGWCYHEKHYRSYDGKEWGPPTASAPVKPPLRIELKPVVQQQIVLKPLQPLPRVRGPLRVKMGTALAYGVTDITMQIFEQLPGAVLGSFFGR